MIKICKIEDLKGNEVLAKQILTKDLQVLLEKGEVIQKHHISRLKEFEIEEVFILSEDASKKEQILVLKEETQIKVKENMMEIINMHSNGNPLNEKRMIDIAEKVIDDVFQIEELAEKVYEIKEHNADLYEHATNVCSLSVLLAIRLDYSRNDLNDMAIGALIHDIGLQGIERYYVDENIDELDERLSSEYKRHPIYGYSKIEEESWLSELAKDVVLYHHEIIEGAGISRKLREFEKKIQIVQVCDIFDEMINGIGYKKVKVYEALEYLKVNKNTKYSEQIVNTFLNFIAVYPIGSVVLTNENEVGVVLRQNKQFPDRPVIKILKDKNGNIKEGIFVKDLLHENTVFIEKQL